MKAVWQSKGGNEKAREDLKLWAANKCWQILVSSRVWSWAHSGLLEDSYQDFWDTLREDFYSLPLSLAVVCFHCIFRKCLSKIHLILMMADSKEGLFWKLCEERSTLPPPSLLPCQSDACIPVCQSGWPVTCSKDAGQRCTEGTQPGLSWVSILIMEGFDFCCVVFWIIYSSCPEHSTYSM